jgi:hypothetical protein
VKAGDVSAAKVEYGILAALDPMKAEILLAQLSRSWEKQ